MNNDTQKSVRGKLTYSDFSKILIELTSCSEADPDQP